MGEVVEESRGRVVLGWAADDAVLFHHVLTPAGWVFLNPRNLVLCRGGSWRTHFGRSNHYERPVLYAKGQNGRVQKKLQRREICPKILPVHFLQQASLNLAGCTAEQTVCSVVRDAGAAGADDNPAGDLPPLPEALQQLPRNLQRDLPSVNPGVLFLLPAPNLVDKYRQYLRFVLAFGHCRAIGIGDAGQYGHFGEAVQG